MIYYKSHNDYWSNPKIYSALNNDCSIIEIDVIYHRGEAMLSHSWRPFRWMMYGFAYHYFNFCKNGRVNKTIYLMIDIKTNNRKIISIIGNLISHHQNDKVLYLIRGDEKNKKRRSIAEEIYISMKIFGNVQLYSQWVADNKNLGHEIISRDLWNGGYWWKRLNHF